MRRSTSEHPPVVYPRSGRPIIAGGLVGQVNGRPIYVDEFFRPIADDLEIRSRELSRNEFILYAELEIRRHLMHFVYNELMYAEAEASLTDFERVGLRHLLREIEQDVTTQRGRGSAIEADQRLLEERGVTVEEQVAATRRGLLVQHKVVRRLEERVVVTWRDIERYYHDHSETFNPPASILLRLIRVPADDEGAIAAVSAMLADGVPFEHVAAQRSVFRPTQGGLMPEVPLGQGLSATPLTAWPQVDDLVHTLSPGEYAGPVVTANHATWVYVERFEDGAGRTLYEAQHEIEQLIRDQRIRAEEDRYLDELRRRGHMDDFEDMVIDLLDVAMRRWAPPQEPRR